MFSMGLVYALPPAGNLTNECFASVDCVHYTDSNLSNYNYSEYCTIKNIHSPVKYKTIIVDIIQGGHYDSARNHQLIIPTTSPYYNGDYSFFVNGAVNPTYVLCHGAVDVNEVWTRNEFLDSWTTANFNAENQNINNSFDFDTIETNDIYLNPEEDNLIFFIGILLIVLGAFFGIIDTVNISRRW